MANVDIDLEIGNSLHYRESQRLFKRLFQYYFFSSSCRGKCADFFEGSFRSMCMTEL